MRTLILLVGAALPVAGAARALAAQVLVQAPADCLDSSTLTDEVDDLIGKRLASVAGVDFRIQIAERPPHGWRLHLVTVDPRRPTAGTPAVLGTREIDGASCHELAEAASVAIAVAVRSIAAEAPPPEAPRPAAPPPPTAAPPALPPAPQTSLVRGPPPGPSWRRAVALAFATDSGVLPSTALGVDLEGSLQRGALRLVGLATWFGSEDTIGANNRGGTFQLLLGGALGCWAPRWGRLTPLGCGGFELGRLTGTGLDVARPTTGDALWRAARVDLGGATTLGSGAALFVRAGLAVPFARPGFVLDGNQLVYRPSRLSARLTAGLQLEF